MQHISIVPISSESPLGFTHKKCAADEKAFVLWCKEHFIDIIGFQNVRLDTLVRMAAIAFPCAPYSEAHYKHPTIEDCIINWHSSHTKPRDFATAESRINKRTSF